MLDRCRVRLGISRRRTSSGCAVPHCASNSMVVQRTQSGKDTFSGAGQSAVNGNFSFSSGLQLLTLMTKESLLTLYCVTLACLYGWSLSITE